MVGFNEPKTGYFVEHGIRRGYKPYRCSTIQSIGGCLGDRCPSYKEVA